MSQPVSLQTRLAERRKPNPMLFRLRAIAGCVAVLCWAAAAHAQAPVVHWASDPVSPGEIVLLVGEGFGGTPEVSVHRIGEQTSDERIVQPAQVSAGSIKVAIPQDFAPGQYELTVRTPDGSADVVLNAPSVYWSRMDLDASGKGQIRIFGRNIARTAKAALLLKDKTGHLVRLPVEAADLWDGRFPVNTPMQTGVYEAQLWNGDGPESAATTLEDLQVVLAPQEPARTISVPARDDRKGDDTQRINDALQVMSRAGGGTIKLGPGYFRISQTLVVPERVTLRGESEELTSLVLDPAVPPPDVLITGQSNFRISNLSISAGSHNHIIQGGYAAGNKPVPDAHAITIDHVLIRASIYRGHLSANDISEKLSAALRWSSGGPDAIRLSGTDLTVTNSDILSSGRSLYLNQAKNSRIAGNKLYNGRYGWYSISVSSNILFENNSVIGADLQSTGGGINTLFSSGQPASRNIIFKGNTFSRLMGWDREAMTSDGPGGCYAGPVSGSGADRLVLPDINLDPARFNPCIGGAAIFLSGAGRGEVKRVTSVDNTGLTVDSDLPIGDGEAQAVIGPIQENYLIIANHFEDTGPLQFFGTSIRHVIADNTFERSDGIFLRSLKYKELQPILFIQILNNTILSAPLDRPGLIQVRTQPPKEATMPLLIGVVIRGNTLLSNSSINVVGSDNQNSGIEDIVIEGNSVAQTNQGILVDQSVSAALLKDNRFAKVKTPITDKSRRQNNIP